MQAHGKSSRRSSHIPDQEPSFTGDAAVAQATQVLQKKNGDEPVSASLNDAILQVNASYAAVSQILMNTSRHVNLTIVGDDAEKIREHLVNDANKIVNAARKLKATLDACEAEVLGLFKDLATAFRKGQKTPPPVSPNAAATPPDFYDPTEDLWIVECAYKTALYRLEEVYPKFQFLHHSFAPSL